MMEFLAASKFTVEGKSVERLFLYAEKSVRANHWSTLREIANHLSMLSMQNGTKEVFSQDYKTRLAEYFRLLTATLRKPPIKMIETKKEETRTQTSEVFRKRLERANRIREEKIAALEKDEHEEREVLTGEQLFERFASLARYKYPISESAFIARHPSLRDICTIFVESKDVSAIVESAFPLLDREIENGLNPNLIPPLITMAYLFNPAIDEDDKQMLLLRHGLMLTEFSSPSASDNIEDDAALEEYLEEARLAEKKKNRLAKNGNGSH